MKIPKFEKGGIIYENPIILGDYDREYVIPLIDPQQYLKIYHRTKNRRIKKKALKKCPMLYLQERIKKNIGLGSNMKNFEIKINGEKIEKEVE